MFLCHSIKNRARRKQKMQYVGFIVSLYLLLGIGYSQFPWDEPPQDFSIPSDIDTEILDFLQPRLMEARKILCDRLKERIQRQSSFGKKRESALQGVLDIITNQQKLLDQLDRDPTLDVDLYKILFYQLESKFQEKIGKKFTQLSPSQTRKVVPLLKKQLSRTLQNLSDVVSEHGEKTLYPTPQKLLDILPVRYKENFLKGYRPHVTKQKLQALQENRSDEASLFKDTESVLSPYDVILWIVGRMVTESVSDLRMERLEQDRQLIQEALKLIQIESALGQKLKRILTTLSQNNDQQIIKIVFWVLDNFGNGKFPLLIDSPFYKEYYDWIVARMAEESKNLEEQSVSASKAKNSKKDMSYIKENAKNKIEKAFSRKSIEDKLGGLINKGINNSGTYQKKAEEKVSSLISENMDKVSNYFNGWF